MAAWNEKRIKQEMKDWLALTPFFIVLILCLVIYWTGFHV